MAYLGVPPQSGFISQEANQYFTGLTQNSIDLNQSISSLSSVIVLVNGVVQENSDLTLTSSTRITLGATLVSGDKVTCIYVAKISSTQAPATGSVTSDMLSGSIADAKITGLSSSKLSGVVPTANLGSGTASSGTVLFGDQTFKTAPSGGLKFISKLESTSDTDTLVFNSIMDNTTYSAYKVIATLVSGGNGAEINFRFRRGGGAQSATNYRYANFMYSGELGTANVGGTNVNLANLATDASTTAMSIEMNLIPSGSVGQGGLSIGHWKGMIDKYNSNTRKARTIMGAFYYDNSDVPDGFQIVNQTANFEDYEIFVYGMVKA